MSKKSKDTFIKGAAILGIAGLICKVIGAFYRVALVNILTPTGMAYYEMSYPIYSFLLVISTAGLPTAISKIVSEKVSTKDYKSAHRVFQVSYRLLFGVGLVTTALMLLGAGVYARVYNLPEAVFAIRAIAPALFFVSIISAYRGYFQGLQIMTPTALSQLVEQVGKLVAFAKYFSRFGLHYGAMGALLGVSISELAAMLLLLFMYKSKKAEIKENMKLYRETKRESRGKIMAKIFAVAFPITIGASVMPLAGMVDGYIAMNLLPVAGYVGEAAQQLYGIYSGSITSIVNMPAVISLSIGVSLVPAIAGARAVKDKYAAKNTTRIGVKIAILFALPCAVGMNLLAEPILHLLYKNSLSAYEFPIAVRLLKIMAFAVMFLTLVQVMTSILQGYGKYKIPVINLIVGSLINVGMSALLVVRPSYNIAGVAIGTVCCYAFAALSNMACVFRCSRIKFSGLNYVVRPIFANAIMAVVVYLTFPVLQSILGSSSIALLATIGVAVITYLVTVIVIKAIGPEDMDYIPAGGRLKRLLIKLKIWKKVA